MPQNQGQIDPQIQNPNQNLTQSQLAQDQLLNALSESSPINNNKLAQS